MQTNASNRTRAALVVVSVLTLVASSVIGNPLVRPNEEYTQDYRVENCTFVSKGESTYFILKPGYQLVFEGIKEGMQARWVHTVLDRTETIEVPGIGEVEIRAVDEKEWADGEITETSTAFYAICKETGDLYDFGDDVYVHNADGTVTHEGSWRAGQPDADGLAKPGITMPGTFLVGARYFQQMADGYSVERAENLEDGLTITTPAGTFHNCVRVFESNVIEEDYGATYKTHAPGVGLLGEGPLELVAYGYHIEDIDIGPIEVTEDAKSVTRKISDEQAREIALKAVPGEVMDVALERKMGGKRIVVEIIAAADKAEVDVIIDKDTGKVLGIER